MWSKELRLSFNEIDEMDFEILLELAAVHFKINDALYSPNKSVCYIDDIL